MNPTSIILAGLLALVATGHASPHPDPDSAHNPSSSSRRGRVGMVNVVQFENGECTTTSGHSGTCYTEGECTEKGGAVDGNCAQGLRNR